jgi:hypothetical protein
MQITACLPRRNDQSISDTLPVPRVAIAPVPGSTQLSCDSALIALS